MTSSHAPLPTAAVPDRSRTIPARGAASPGQRSRAASSRSSSAPAPSSTASNTGASIPAATADACAPLAGSQTVTAQPASASASALASPSAPAPATITLGPLLIRLTSRPAWENQAEPARPEGVQAHSEGALGPASFEGAAAWPPPPIPPPNLPAGPPPRPRPSKGPDAVALLKADHRAVEKLFGQFDKAKDAGRKKALADKICTWSCASTWRSRRRDLLSHQPRLPEGRRHSRRSGRRTRRGQGADGRDRGHAAGRRALRLPRHRARRADRAPCGRRKRPSTSLR